MDLSGFMDYIVMVVVGICLCVGYIIKHAIPSDKINRYIPLIMAGLGLVLNLWAKWAITPEYVLEGLFSGLASTGLYEAFTNLIDKKTHKDDNSNNNGNVQAY